MDDICEIFMEIEDEDYEIEVQRRRGPTKLRDRIDNFEKWDESEFFERYRMHKDTANRVLLMIGDKIRPRSNKNRPITPATKFLTALRFYASGSFLINISDSSGIHYSSVSKIVKEVSHAIAEMCPELIKMPVGEEQQKVVQDFFQIARFPNCIGALDCTHVKIQSVGGDDAELYRNRKGVFSINVQAVCDGSLIIRNIVARWPGSAHDSHIFNSSNLRRDMESGVYKKGVLVGDSGYGCTNYLIPPLEHVEMPEERMFQESQVRTRNPIERCFGVWKRRFPVLSLGLRLKLDRLESVIIATAVLHNICRRQGEDDPPITDEEVQLINILLENDVGLQGARQLNNRRPIDQRNLVTRNNLIYGYFRSLMQNHHH